MCTKTVAWTLAIALIASVGLTGCRLRCTELCCQSDNECVAGEVCDSESECCIEDDGE